MTFLRRMAAGGRWGHVTVHGFRSAFSDWCTEQTNFSSEAREMALKWTPFVRQPEPRLEV